MDELPSSKNQQFLYLVRAGDLVRNLALVSVRFALLPIRDLKTHEVAEIDRVRRVMRQMRSTGLVKKAIVVDSKSMVVLDGAHRLTAMQMLGCQTAPAWLLDYSDDDVVVLSKDKRSQIPKDVVIRAANEGPKLPPKSTYHMLRGSDGALVHISKIEGSIAIPLATLMQPP